MSLAEPLLKAVEGEPLPHRTIELEVHLPDWVRYVAQAKDGTWQMFAGLPEPTGGGNFPRWWESLTCRSDVLVRGHVPSPNWRETLRRV